MTSIKQHETVRDLRKTIQVPITREDLAVRDVIKAAESTDPPRSVPYDRDTVIDSVVSGVEDPGDVEAVGEAAKAFVDEYGEEFDPQSYQGNAKLRVDPGPSGTTITSGRSDAPRGAQGGEPRTSGTMADYKSSGGQGGADGLSGNVAGSGGTTSAGTMADYKEKQAKADARPVRIVDDDELAGNSLTAYKEREAADTIHVVGTLGDGDDSGLSANASGTGSGTFASLRATKGAERVRISDEPGADPVRISDVNTAGKGGTMSDYRARRDARDVVVVNPDALPDGAI